MGAKEILEQYRAGERKPVPGPLTYPEALALVEQRDKLLAALKDVTSVASSPDIEKKRLAHYAAVFAIAEVEVA